MSEEVWVVPWGLFVHGVPAAARGSFSLQELSVASLFESVSVGGEGARWGQKRQRRAPAPSLS